MSWYIFPWSNVGLNYLSTLWQQVGKSVKERMNELNILSCELLIPFMSLACHLNNVLKLWSGSSGHNPEERWIFPGSVTRGQPRRPFGRGRQAAELPRGGHQSRITRNPSELSPHSWLMYLNPQSRSRSSNWNSDHGPIFVFVRSKKSAARSW